MLRFFQYLKNFDWILFAAVALLVVFGLVEIYSVALGQGDERLMNFKKQLAFAAVGFLLLFFVSIFDYRALKSYSAYIFGFSLVILSAVLFFGEVVRGTRGWFYIGGQGFQPVEIAKVMLVAVLARIFASRFMGSNQPKYLALASGAALAVSALVFFQPDFGSAMIMLLLWFAMLVAAGFDAKYYLAIILALSLIGAGAWGFYFKDYQKERVLTFLNPSFDPLDQGYNIAQAIIAVGAGRMFGRGIGFGSQSQLKFLPESQNDFIFAVIGEELGFLGVLLVAAFFSTFFIRIFYHIRRLKDPFAAYFMIGAACLIFIEMFINIGMNIGLLPVVGISLPFVSYGGSALISSLILVGVIESIIIRSKERGSMG
jgi:rod shape determining protein RodA